MNIMHFADYKAPYEGNFILSLKALEEKIKSENMNMIYVFTKGAKSQKWAQELVNQKKTVYFLGDSFIKNITAFARIIRRHNIKLIHTHFSIFKYDLTLKIARILSKKTVYVRHMHMLYKNKKNPLAEKLKRFVANADIEISCNKSVYQAMRDEGFNPANMITVTNAVDFSRIDSFENIDRKTFGIPENSKVVLMFGYNYPVKGVDLAVRAVNTLNEKGRDTTLLIVAASGAEQVKECIINDFGKIEGHIKFLPPRNDIASYYKMADVFLSASRSEGLSYALIEAKYCGVLTVASDIPGNVRESDELMFESENVSSLVDKLEYAFDIGDDYKSNILSRQKDFAIREFGLDRWIDDIIKIYSDVYKRVNKKRFK
ncbi:MAG: glycosyltransferase family 4 protein [Monoglobales bacterium]